MSVISLTTEAAMTERADVERSPAFQVLGPSARKLLAFVERQIRHSGGGGVMLFNDQLDAAVGSRRYVQGLAILNPLGLVRVARAQKKWLISISDGWRDVASPDHATVLADVARLRRMPVQRTTQPASSGGSVTV
jgi:hypothetical protein